MEIKLRRANERAKGRTKKKCWQMCRLFAFHSLISLFHFSPVRSSCWWDFDWIIHSRPLSTTTTGDFSSSYSYHSQRVLVSVPRPLMMRILEMETKNLLIVLSSMTPPRRNQSPTITRQPTVILWNPRWAAMWSLRENTIEAVNWWVNPSYHSQSAFQEKSLKNDLWMLISVFTRISIQDGIMVQVMKYGSFIEVEVMSLVEDAECVCCSSRKWTGNAVQCWESCMERRWRKMTRLFVMRRWRQSARLTLCWIHSHLSARWLNMHRDRRQQKNEELKKKFLMKVGGRGRDVICECM